MILRSGFRQSLAAPNRQNDRSRNDQDTEIDPASQIRCPEGYCRGRNICHGMKNDRDDDTTARIIMQPGIEDRQDNGLQKILVHRDRGLGRPLDKEEGQMPECPNATQDQTCAEGG